MKKLFIILASLGALMVFLVVIARLTNVYAVYSIPTESNLPTLKVGQNVLGTSLKRPKQGDFISYKHDNGIWMHRCVALAGDIIELKNAELYINGKKVNEPYVYNEYKMLRKDFARIAGFVERNENPVMDEGNDMLVSLTDAELETYKIKPEKNILDRLNVIYDTFQKQGFSPDNFGPLKVPENKVFVLGDNRHNSADSRYTGFVDTEDVVTTIINH